MRTVLTLKDVRGGAYIVRNSYPDDSTNYSFMSTVVHKICWQQTKDGQMWYLSDVMSDGMLWRKSTSKEDLFEKLDKDQFGYRVLTEKEFLKLYKKYLKWLNKY